MRDQTIHHPDHQRNNRQTDLDKHFFNSEKTPDKNPEPDHLPDLDEPPYKNPDIKDPLPPEKSKTQYL